MARIIDIAGQRFGKLTVIQYAGNDKGRKVCWLCKCDCGNSVIVRGNNLRSGNTQSCGCVQRERASNSHTKHGGNGTRLYRIWHGMKDRCLNPNCKEYKWYCGRGITVCEEWLDFQAFRDWALSNGYADDLTIDRIDVNGNYEPGNCRWATMKEQQNNRRNNRYLTYNGGTHTLAEWSKITGLNRGTLSSRINSLNWDIERALTISARKVGAQCRD